MPWKKQCHPSNELVSSVCYFKRHFSSSRCNRHTVVDCAVARCSQKKTWKGICYWHSQKYCLSVKKKHTQDPKIVWLDMKLERNVI